LTIGSVRHLCKKIAEFHNVEVVGLDKPMQCATAEGITIINFGMDNS